MLHAVVRTLEIGVDQLVEAVGRQVERWAGDLLGGVVDGDIEPAIGFDGPRDESLNVVFAGDIGMRVKALAATGVDLVEGFITAVVVDIAYGNFRVTLGEGKPQDPAKALGRARDQYSLVPKVGHPCPSLANRRIPVTRS